MADTQNPYAAPRAEDLAASPIETQLELIDATQGVRFANFVLDMIFREIGVVTLYVFWGRPPGSVLAFVYTSLAIFVYYAFFEALTGRTPAKYLTRTRVVDAFGGRPNFGQILRRTAARFIPFEPFSCLGSPSHGWHDSMSKTRVVRVNRK